MQQASFSNQATATKHPAAQVHIWQGVFLLPARNGAEYCLVVLQSKNGHGVE